MAKHSRRRLVVRCNCDRAGGGYYESKNYEYAFPRDDMSRGIVADAKSRYIVDRNIVAGDRGSITTTTSIRNY